MIGRSAVYDAIDSERSYQDARWSPATTQSHGLHSLEEWLIYMRDYVEEALHTASRTSKQESDPKLLDSIRKVAGLAVAAMEQHGAPKRQSY